MPGTRDQIYFLSTGSQEKEGRGRGDNDFRQLFGGDFKPFETHELEASPLLGFQ